MLYPTELRAHTYEPKLRTKNGRSGGIRTPDILLPKQARYQAALHSERLADVSGLTSFQEVRMIPTPLGPVNGKDKYF